jgi:replicative DNA helicase
MSAPDVVACAEAEAAVIGCLLAMTQVDADGLAMQLEVDDFGDPKQQAVFQAARDCLLDDTPADPVTVLGEMRRTGLERSMTADRTAGVYLADLLAAAPAVVNGGRYARVVVEHSFRRRLTVAADRLRQLAETGTLEHAAEVAHAEWLALHDLYDRFMAGPAVTG